MQRNRCDKELVEFLTKQILILTGLQRNCEASVRSLSLRSRRQRKAWGASPRITKRKIWSPRSGRQSVARFAGSIAFLNSILGLAPQALRCRPLRGLAIRGRISGDTQLRRGSQRSCAGNCSDPRSACPASSGIQSCPDRAASIQSTASSQTRD